MKHNWILTLRRLPSRPQDPQHSSPQTAVIYRDNGQTFIITNITKQWLCGFKVTSEFWVNSNKSLLLFKIYNGLAFVWTLRRLRPSPDNECQKIKPDQLDARSLKLVTAQENEGRTFGPNMSHLIENSKVIRPEQCRTTIRSSNSPQTAAWAFLLELLAILKSPNRIMSSKPQDNQSATLYTMKSIGHSKLLTQTFWLKTDDDKRVKEKNLISSKERSL